MDIYAAEELEGFLPDYPELEHIEVRRHGKSLILCSGQKDDRQDHARFTCLGRNEWGLSFPNRSGRWEKTPIIDTLENLLSFVVKNFSFYLQRW